MKFNVESDGTLEGTKMEFSMTAAEIPQMIEGYQRRRAGMRLKRTQPADVVVSENLPQEPPVQLVRTGHSGN